MNNKLFSLTQRKLDNAFTCLLSSKCLQQIVSHGDCNYFNYIFDGESFFFIDYDRAGTHFFFCDCFFYIFWQYYILNDSSLIENCLNGKYDCLFTSLFERFDAQYNNKFIYIYILLTIYDVSDWEGNIDMINSLERLATKYDEKQ